MNCEFYLQECRGGPSAGGSIHPKLEIDQGTFRSRSQTASKHHPLPVASETASATDLCERLSVNPDGMSTHFSQPACLHGDKGRLIEGVDEENSRRIVQGVSGSL